MFDSLLIGAVGFCSWYTYCLLAAFLYTIAYILEVELDLPVWDHECPGIAHLKLKRFITKITREAMRLPELFNQSGVPPRQEEHMPFFDPKKYEQLVATAVLNKIIETYRNPDNVYVENSSGVHTGSDTENGRSEAVGQFQVDAEAEDSTDLNEYVLKHKVPLPDLSGLDSGESTTDDMSSTRSTGTEGTWEENWLFKKKKLKAETSASIAMLVPSPTEEVKALIGDKNADEVSDLSEAEDVEQTDSDEDEGRMGGVKELPSVLVQSKTLIGGKNELLSFDDNSSPGDSLVSNPDSGINVTDARNEALLTGDEDFVRVERPVVVEAINESKVTPVAAPRKLSREESTTTTDATNVVAATPESSVNEDNDAEEEEEEEDSQLAKEQRAIASLGSSLTAAAAPAGEDVSAEDDKERIEKDSSGDNGGDYWKVLTVAHLDEMKPESIPTVSGPISPVILDSDSNWIFNCGQWTPTTADEAYLKGLNGRPRSTKSVVEATELADMRSQPLEIINFLDELKPDTVPLVPQLPSLPTEELESVGQSGGDVIDEAHSSAQNDNESQQSVHLVELESVVLVDMATSNSETVASLNEHFNGHEVEESSSGLANLIDSNPLQTIPVLAGVDLNEDEQGDNKELEIPKIIAPPRRGVAQPPKDAKPGEIVNVNGVLWRDGMVIREMCWEPMDDAHLVNKKRVDGSKTIDSEKGEERTEIIPKANSVPPTEETAKSLENIENVKIASSNVEPTESEDTCENIPDAAEAVGSAKLSDRGTEMIKDSNISPERTVDEANAIDGNEVRPIPEIHIETEQVEFFEFNQITAETKETAAIPLKPEEPPAAVKRENEQDPNDVETLKAQPGQTDSDDDDGGGSEKDSASGWVFVESGWVNNNAGEAEVPLNSEVVKIEEEEFPVVSTRPEFEPIAEEEPIDGIINANTATPDTAQQAAEPSESVQPDPIHNEQAAVASDESSWAAPIMENFLDFLQPHTIPASIGELYFPAGEFVDTTLLDRKPVGIPMATTAADSPIESATLASSTGWEFTSDSRRWRNPVSESSRLESSGRPGSHDTKVIGAGGGGGFGEAGAEVELLEGRGCPFESDYLMDLKPALIPFANVSPIGNCAAISGNSIRMPAPEVELLSEDQFVCVMTYDVDSQQIVCGMPISKKAAAESSEINTPVAVEDGKGGSGGENTGDLAASSINHVVHGVSVAETDLFVMNGPKDGEGSEKDETTDQRALNQSNAVTRSDEKEPNNIADEVDHSIGRAVSETATSQFSATPDDIELVPSGEKLQPETEDGELAQLNSHKEETIVESENTHKIDSLSTGQKSDEEAINIENDLANREEPKEGINNAELPGADIEFSSSSIESVTDLLSLEDTSPPSSSLVDAGTTTPSRPILLQTVSVEPAPQTLSVELSSNSKAEEATATLSTSPQITPSSPAAAKRYTGELFEHLLPKAPIPVVKLSDQLSRSPSSGGSDPVVDGDPSPPVTNSTNDSTPALEVVEQSSNDYSPETTVLVANDEMTEEAPLVAEPRRQQPPHSHDERLVPGSLAEREHLKWLHATAEIPNNPYSPEALEKRLLGSTSNIGMGFGAAPASLQSLEATTTSLASSSGNSENERDVGEEEVLQANGHALVEKEQQQQQPHRSIQTVLGGGAGNGVASNENDYKRYGRDYYINAAKRASGSRKKLEGASPLESPSSELPPAQRPIEQYPAEDIMMSPHQPFDGRVKVKVLGSNDELFLAKPIMVQEDDELLQRATKLSHLSTETRDVYLLPLDGDGGCDSPTMTSLSSDVDAATTTNTNASSSSNPPESLSLSEDSDTTTRIYDITTMETRFEKKPTRTTVSPETVKFFAPKTIPNFSKSSASEKPDSLPVKETSPTPPLPLDNTNADLINRLVIEDDVLPVLPSVRKLANVFASKQTTEPPNLAPLQRPKSLDPLSSNELPAEPAESRVAAAPRIVTIKKDSNPHLFKPGYSITGRSLSKQFKEELKQSTNAPEENNNEVDCVNRNGTSSAEGRVTPERSPSPVLIPGRLKNNIAFYENLKRH